MGTMSSATSPSPGRRPRSGTLVVGIDDAAHEADDTLAPGRLDRRAEQRLADTSPPRARLHTNHRVLPAGGARARQVRVAAAEVEEADALAGLEVPEGDPVVRMGGVEDL